MCDAEKLRELEQDTGEVFRQLSSIASRIMRAGLEEKVCPDVVPVLMEEVAKAAIPLDMLHSGLNHLAMWNEDPDSVAETIGQSPEGKIQDFLQRHHGRN